MKSRIIKTKKVIAVAILLGLTAGISTAAVEVWVFGNGVETGQDRDSTDSQAYNDATTQANAICPGYIEGNYIKTADTCGNFGSEDNPSWMCTVSVKALCKAGR
ncbi:MAG: hypothetical protein WBR26_13125 [Candidatus Acidiferrum sp.]